MTKVVTLQNRQTKNPKEVLDEKSRDKEQDINGNSEERDTKSPIAVSSMDDDSLGEVQHHSRSVASQKENAKDAKEAIRISEEGQHS